MSPSDTSREYEVRAWITVRAEDEQQAEAKAAAILDTVADEHRDATSVGHASEGEVYEA